MKAQTMAGIFKQLESYFIPQETPVKTVFTNLEAIHANGSCDPRFCPVCEAERNEGDFYERN